MRPLGTAIAILAIIFGITFVFVGPGLLGLSKGDAMAKTVSASSMIIAAVAFLFLLSWWVRTRADHLQIKEDEVVWTKGIFNKSYTEVSMTSVRTVRVDQNLFERLLGVGSLTIFTSGDEPELVVPGLPDPMAIRELIQAQGKGDAPA